MQALPESTDLSVHQVFMNLACEQAFLRSACCESTRKRAAKRLPSRAALALLLALSLNGNLASRLINVIKCVCPPADLLYNR